jgi:hypothetical protein
MPSEVLRWYTRAELAARWHVAEKTVSNWLSLARADGRGPTQEQYQRRGKRRGQPGCVALIRADYANGLWRRFCVRLSSER